MDTKLKRINMFLVKKLIVMAVVAFTFAFSVVSVVYAGVKFNDLNVSWRDDFVQLNDEQEIYRVSYALEFISQHKSEEYIRSDEFWENYIKINYQYTHNESEYPNRDNLVADIILTFRNNMEILEELSYIYYYYDNGQIILKNSELSSIDDFMLLDFRVFTGGNIKDENTIESNYVIENTKYLAIGYDNDYAREQQTQFLEEKKAVTDVIYPAMFSAGIGALGMIYLMVMKDKRKYEPKIYDKIWTEVLLIVTVTFMICLFNIMFNSTLYRVRTNSNNILLISAITAYIFIVLIPITDVFKRLHHGIFIRNSFCYSIYMLCKKVVTTMFVNTSLTKKVRLIIGLGSFITMILVTIAALADAYFILFGIFIVEAIGLIYILLRYVLNPYDDQLKRINYESLQKAMKAERLKTDLITNVSHDLKTPLTAILNYSDLLVKENEDNEYAKVIYEKAQKLKHLTEDLFEVSKVQSGNIVVNNEELDLGELINQSLAEFDDCALRFKVDIDNIKIIADGRLMSRVFGNLIGNMIKYSLDNTRAYIDATKVGLRTVITFKNVASYEMNFKSDEITERFTRGDISRTTEGNGLGLAIAKSYTEACGGKFDVVVDGDLFKVTITI